ncbi:MAG: MlaE family lipid ABC transporter permease subunit [Phormidesmis sp.]
MVKADRRLSQRIAKLLDNPAPRSRPGRKVSRVHHNIEADNPFYHTAMAVLLAGQVMHRLLQGRIGQRQIMDHLMCAGPRCLAPAIMTNICAGIIFATQSAREMSRFGSISSLGSVFAAAYCRELAPLLTAGVLACQVGSAFAAEIAAMKLTQQIDALKMLRTDPIDYLVMPRVIACAIMLPILTILGLCFGVAGGGLITTTVYDLSMTSFLDGLRSNLQVADVLRILAKAVVFGGVIAIASCSRGLTAARHGRGVGESATAAVVTAWVGLFTIDLFLSGLVLFRMLH